MHLFSKRTTHRVNDPAACFHTAFDRNFSGFNELKHEEKESFSSFVELFVSFFHHQTVRIFLESKKKKLSSIDKQNVFEKKHHRPNTHTGENL